MKYLIFYLILVNFSTFLLYGIDKSKARHHRWRIPEAVLLGAAAIGGSLGALSGMYFFRHKTKHWKFRILVPLCLIAQIVLLFLFFA